MLSRIPGNCGTFDWSAPGLRELTPNRLNEVADSQEQQGNNRVAELLRDMAKRDIAPGRKFELAGLVASIMQTGAERL